jgi:Aminoglycoside adenylyltransferase, C-terminal domain
MKGGWYSKMPCPLKDAGGLWGLDHLPEQDHPLIHQALALSRSERREAKDPAVVHCWVLCFST